MKKDYYAVLGVRKFAPAKEVTHAYRKLAHKFHPDKNKDCGEAEKSKNEERLKDVNEAYSVLANVDLCEYYDQLLRQEMEEQHRRNLVNAQRKEAFDKKWKHEEEERHPQENDRAEHDPEEQGSAEEQRQADQRRAEAQARWQQAADASYKAQTDEWQQQHGGTQAEREARIREAEERQRQEVIRVAAEAAAQEQARLRQEAWDKKQGEERRKRIFIAIVVAIALYCIMTISVKWLNGYLKEVDVELRNARAQQSASETFRVEVNYDQDPAKIIKAGNYSGAYEACFPAPKRGGTKVVELALVNFSGEATSTEVLAELDKFGLRAATLQELLAFDYVHPEIINQYTIVALDSVCRDSNGGGSVAVLFNWRNGRQLDLTTFGIKTNWNDRVRFLAVHK